MGATSPAVANLRRAAATLGDANRTLGNVHAGAAKHDAQSYATSERLIELEADRENNLVAVRLGERPTRPEVDAVEIDRLCGEATVNERVAATFKSRITQAEKATVAADVAYKAAAKAYVNEAGVNPAREAFAAGLESLGPLAIRYMAAYLVANVKFNPNGAANFSNADSMYGPAAALIRHLIQHRWEDTLRPTWVPKHGPMLHPWDLDGMKDAEQKLLAKVKEATQ